MDPDMNKYDLNHRLTAHPRMTPDEWDRAYQLAWRNYYAWEHIETILRRVVASRGIGRFRVNPTATMFNIGWFKGSIEIEGIHPLEGGFLRRRYRRDRRPGRGIEPAWRFYPRFVAGTAVKQARWAALFARLGLIYWRVVRDPKRAQYMDAALAAVRDDEIETHELFRSEAARAYVGQERRLHAIREGRGEPAPANLASAKKCQNKITEYRKLLLAFKNVGILTYAGYILGFPNDTKESILHDLEVIKRELPLELLEVFYLTPLPGSEDHQRLHRAGVPMDADLNEYDLSHRTTGHARMTPQEWEEAYKEAWQHYYAWEHIETILRRAATTGRRQFRVNVKSAMLNMAGFKGSIGIEGIHPLEGGFFRLKYRRDRRPELGIEPIWRFYPKLFAEALVKHAKWAVLYARLGRIYWRVMRDPKRIEYMDTAITPVTDHEEETSEMLQSEAAKAYISQERRLQDIRTGTRQAEAA
jgi:hypothetical protein